MYEISKERLLQIAKDSPKSKVKIKQWYPDVFDFKKGWYKVSGGSDIYMMYFKEIDQGTTYGAMNGIWTSRLGYVDQWSREFIENDKAAELLIKAGVDNGKIHPETDTSLWWYDIDEDKITKEDGLVVYLRGVWHTSSEAFSPNSSRSVWEGEGWYKCIWTYSFCHNSVGYVYLRSQSATKGHGFYDGQYREHVYIETASIFTKCSIDEIKTLMINEAIRRNYNEQNIISLGGDSGFDNNIDKWSFYTDVLYTADVGCGGMIAYKHGVWALKTI
jgi:hypothetical protein